MSSENPAPSVLVVDDTLENLRLLSHMLGEKGYDVRAVTNGRQALRAVEDDPPDLILLDAMMPEMNGFEVCRQLKSHSWGRDVPIMFLTALNDTTDKLRAFDAGAVDYITKPFQIEEVHARVRTHIELRRAGRDLADSYKQLRKLEELRDDLVHMVVHDMGSPLTAALARLDVLKLTQGSLSQEYREDLDAAIGACTVLMRMTHDLLDVRRFEAGRMPIAHAMCDVSRIAKGVCASLGASDRDRPLEIECPAPVELNCDESLVRRVIENLVSNGFKHTPDGSPLRISISRKPDAVRVEVRDSGSGVAPDNRAKIFEKFGSIEAYREHTYHSAGLGLAFCKLAVEAHGGSIGVDAGVPTGSTFWFELPA
jgi:signal transduction histidine kinase